MSRARPGQRGDPFDIVGTVVDGRYRVERVSGEGGFGVIYAALHLAFESPIALKVLKVPLEVTPEGARSRVAAFQREGKVLFELSSLHQSILRAFEAGTIALADGRAVPYLALEWLEGTSLAQEAKFRRQKGLAPLALAELLALLEGPAAALALAHERGIVHRDIKPGNLFVTRGPRGSCVKVLDFGIAKIVEEALEPEHDGALRPHHTSAFTPMYAAPEQWLPCLGATTSATDVHALALVCAELLSGRTPFAGTNSTELMNACLDPTARPTPGRLGLGLTPAVEEVFARALALEPHRRFPAAGDFFAALSAAAAWAPGPHPVEMKSLGAPSAVSALPRATDGASASTVTTASGTVAHASRPSTPPRAQRLRSALTLMLFLSLGGVVASNTRLRVSGPANSSEVAPARVAEPSLVLASASARPLTTTPPPVVREDSHAVPVRRKPRQSRGVSNLNAARASLRDGKVARACAEAEAVLAENQACAECTEFLGGCYMRLGERERGLARYETYLKLEPHGRDAEFVRAMIDTNKP